MAEPGNEKKRTRSEVSSQSDTSINTTPIKSEKKKQKPNEEEKNEDESGYKIIQAELKQINKKLENVMTKNDKTLITLIKDTIKTMKEELLASTEKKVDVLESKLFEKEKEIDKMKVEHDKLKEDMTKMHKEMSIQNENIDRYKQEMRHSAMKTDEYLNNHEQYSRINNIRISGIPEETFTKNAQNNKNNSADRNEKSDKNEDEGGKSPETNTETYAEKVQNSKTKNENTKEQFPENDEQTTEIVLNKINQHIPGLNLERRDIVISHRLGKIGYKPRPIIVQFQSRLDKNKIMRNRRLFPKTISIMDDLTSQNYKTLQSVKYKKPDLVQTAWIRNGRIFFKDHSDYVTKLSYNKYPFWMNLPWPERVQRK